MSIHDSEVVASVFEEYVFLMAALTAVPAARKVRLQSVSDQRI
jgi:hypothetical protein